MRKVGFQFLRLVLRTDLWFMSKVVKPKLDMTQKLDIAKGLYMSGNLTRKEIAARSFITDKTLRKYIEEDNWEAEKNAKFITRPHLLQQAFNKLGAINKKIHEELGNVPDKQLSDAVGVIIKEIETLSSNVPLHQYIEMFEEMVQFIESSFPEHLLTWAEISSDFLAEISKRK